MNKKVILVVSVVALFFMSCNQTKKEEFIAVAKVNNDLTPALKQEKSEGYILMKNNCYVCHNPNATSHDDILAPPFKAVKMHYNRKYDTKKDFVNAMVNWVQNPEEDKALMFGAVRRFKMMPKLPMSTKDLEKIATYIYENDVEEPKWMEKHMKNKEKGCKHKNGKTCSNNC